jgi:hypothetical protein
MLHKEKLHNLYSSPRIIRLVKSRRIRWVGHVTQMGENRNTYRILVGALGSVVFEALFYEP